MLGRFRDWIEFEKEKYENDEACRLQFASC